MKISITIIHPDHPGEIYLLNEKGDTYTAKCSKLIEFIRRTEKIKKTIKNETKP